MGELYSSLGEAPMTYRYTSKGYQHTPTYRSAVPRTATASSACATAQGAADVFGLDSNQAVIARGLAFT